MLAQNQKKLSRLVRTWVASKYQLLLLGALVQCMGFCPLPLGNNKEATISSLGILL